MPASMPRPRRHHRLLITSIVVLIALAGFDMARDPERQWSAGVAIAGIHLYRHTFAHLLESAGVICRFEPTCSLYAETAVRRFGLARGSWLSVRRLVKCGPWTPAGTIDPPPSERL